MLCCPTPQQPPLEVLNTPQEYLADVDGFITAAGLHQELVSKDTII
jgi:uncharacterized protein YbaR (Trm112 family)